MCEHPRDKVYADPFLMGAGLKAPTPVQVNWCSLCGAGRVVYGNPHDGSELKYGSWLNPRGPVAEEQQRAQAEYPDHDPKTALANYRAGREVWDTNGDLL